MIRTTDIPILTAAASLYPYSKALETKFTRVSRYEDLIKLYRATLINGVKHIWLPRNCTPLALNDKRVSGVPISFKVRESFKVKSEKQAIIIEKSTVLLKKGNSHILESPTGSGKTVMAVIVMANVGKKTLIIVPKEDIKYQWVKALKMFLYLKDSDIGYIQGDTCNVKGKKVVIALVQSLSKMGRYPAEVTNTFGLMIIDECHRVAAEHFSNVCWQVPALLRLGLSATPIRKDGKSIVLKAHIGNVLVCNKEYTVVPMVRILTSNFKVPMMYKYVHKKYIKVQIPHSAGRTMNVNKAIALDLNRNTLIAKAVLECYKLARHILILTETIAHVDLIRERLITIGVREKDIGRYIGGMTKGETTVASRKKVVIGTFAYTAEATDIPSLDTLVMATPRSDVVQIVGRILREHDTKKEPLVIDIVDNDSNVLRAYAAKRVEWYCSLDADIKWV